MFRSPFFSLICRCQNACHWLGSLLKRARKWHRESVPSSRQRMPASLRRWPTTVLHADSTAPRNRSAYNRWPPTSACIVRAVQDCSSGTARPRHASLAPLSYAAAGRHVVPPRRRLDRPRASVCDTSLSPTPDAAPRRRDAASCWASCVRWSTACQKSKINTGSRLKFLRTNASRPLPPSVRADPDLGPVHPHLAGLFAQL